MYDDVVIQKPSLTNMTLAELNAELESAVWDQCRDFFEGTTQEYVAQCDRERAVRREISMRGTV